MAKVSAKLRSTEDGYAHWCPGCESMHVFYTNKPAAGGALWTFNGDLERPTFGPSMVITTEAYEDEGVHLPQERCHYWLRSGGIEYLHDSTHQLKGLHIALPDLP
jgi:hypothetical protein